MFLCWCGQATRWFPSDVCRAVVLVGGVGAWYPNPEGGPAVWAVALAVVALVAVSVAVIAVRRRQPWLLTGWFWYLAMLAPTVSMSQARMDRFTYLSQIGVCVA